ncbi:MAG: hypothetical protein ACLPKI_25750 [Streptosporangiaceae bacterium]
MVRKHAGRARGALGAVVILATAGTAGCGIFQQPSTVTAMQHQITTGEQVGAATRAAAAQAEAARLRAGVAAGAQPLTGDRKVTGSQVVAIGDSVMAASALALAGAMPGIYIDAKPDREMPAGLAILRHLAATGRLRPVLVLGLGTNYLVTTSQLSQVLRILGPDRRLVLINTYVPDGWSKQVNRTDAAFAQQHPAVVLADWYDTIRNRMYLLWPDHIHPEIPGTRVYAGLVYRAVQATRDTPGA